MEPYKIFIEQITKNITIFSVIYVSGELSKQIEFVFLSVGRLIKVKKNLGKRSSFELIALIPCTIENLIAIAFHHHRC